MTSRCAKITQSHSLIFFLYSWLKRSMKSPGSDSAECVIHAGKRKSPDGLAIADRFVKKIKGPQARGLRIVLHHWPHRGTRFPACTLRRRSSHRLIYRDFRVQTTFTSLMRSRNWKRITFRQFPPLLTTQAIVRIWVTLHHAQPPTVQRKWNRLRGISG